MKFENLIGGLPPVKKIADARSIIAESLRNSKQRLVVVDDDPTGTQTVHGVRVYMEWGVETLRTALASENTASFISANTRALNADEAVKLALQIGKNIREASKIEGIGAIVASRSDSTLRGHFPEEVKALCHGLGEEMDGIIVAPAFFEAGRYTLNDVHWVVQEGEAIPAAETEFAKDPTFGYRNSCLPLWIEEKTSGEIRADDVVSISVEDIRIGGPDAVKEQLLRVRNGTPVVVNAASYEDLEVFILGLTKAEGQGKRFIYRTAAPFVKVRAGIPDRPLLTAKEIATEGGPGLIVAGSYVGKTTRQLRAIIESGLAEGVEIDVRKLLDAGNREEEIKRGIATAEKLLGAGKSAVIYTSREIANEKGADFLETGKTIMESLCEIIRRLKAVPGFVIAKGGITSMEVARLGLGVTGAKVLGQILPGVPVWRLGGNAKWPGAAYIVFPGNVGDDEAVLKAFEALCR